MSKNLAIKFEKAVRLLSEHFPVVDENNRKPILFHGIRVGVYLYNRDYSENIVLASVLHDAIEWSEITKEMIEELFGAKVCELILASTKDGKIKDKDERNIELIKRCVAVGQDALIVKTADIIDSFKWYEKQNNEDQLLNHCVKNAKLIFQYKPDEFNDNIFEELKDWKDKIEERYL